MNEVPVYKMADNRLRALDRDNRSRALERDNRLLRRHLVDGVERGRQPLLVARRLQDLRRGLRERGPPVLAKRPSLIVSKAISAR